MKVLFFLVLYFNFVFSANNKPKGRFPDYQSHPCKRVCSKKESKVCEYNFTIEQTYAMLDHCNNCTNGNENDCYVPDCNPADGRSKIITVFNSMLPGPTIEVCQYDEIVINLKNALCIEVATIHFHGMTQQGTPGMDGVPMVSQYPILPGGDMTYKFKANQYGTNFYHSHAGISQMADGAYGKLIVRQAEEENVFRNYTKCRKYTYFYDHDLPEHSIILSDWAITPQEPDLGDTNEALLINGYGVTKSNSVPIRKFKVKKGDSYRFRIINAATVICGIKFSIEGHQFDVISSDGNDMEPITVDTLTLQNAERYDIVVRATEKVKMYKMQFVGNSVCKGRCTSAVLEYEGAADRCEEIRKVVIPKSSTMKELNNVVTYDKSELHYADLRSLVEKEHPWNATSVANKFYFSLNGVKAEFSLDPNYKDERYVLGINNITFAKPPVPFQLQDNVTFCNAGKLPKPCQSNCIGCRCPHLIEVKENALVELIFMDGFNHKDTGEKVHSMHLHGFNYWVMGQGLLEKCNSVKALEEMDSLGKLQRNMIKPIMKDTVSIPQNGYTIVRFKADNPGYWFLHCHGTYHSNMGMAMVVKVGKHVSCKRQNGSMY